MEERRKGRCQMCGELVDDEGWDGHTVAVMGDDGWPEPAPCGPIDFEEQRKGERRVKECLLRERVYPTGPCGQMVGVQQVVKLYWADAVEGWSIDRRRAERRKGEK